MFEAIAVFFVVLSVGILVAHALDAFRSTTAYHPYKIGFLAQIRGVFLVDTAALARHGRRPDRRHHNLGYRRVGRHTSGRTIGKTWG